MRWKLTMLITAACFAAVACTNDSAEDRAGELPAMDTTAGGAMVPPAAEEETSPDVTDPANGSDTGSTSGTQDDGADSGGNSTAPPPAAPDRDDAEDDVVATIPARFHGEWNADLSACGTGQSETRLRISADQVRFYESVGQVEAVDVESERVITVTAEYQGEGETWQDERRMTLSADGSSLTVSNGGDLVRQRCP